MKEIRIDLMWCENVIRIWSLTTTVECTCDDVCVRNRATDDGNQFYNQWILIKCSNLIGIMDFPYHKIITMLNAVFAGAPAGLYLI